MAMSGTAMSGTFVFLLFSGRCLPDGDHDDECAVLLFLFFLLCSGRYLPDGGHGDKRYVRCFPSVCGRVRGIDEARGMRYLPDGDHGDE